MGTAVSFNNKLSRRVLIYILLCSSILSIASTGIHILMAFQKDVDRLNQQFDNIESSYIHNDNDEIRYFFVGFLNSGEK